MQPVQLTLWLDDPTTAPMDCPRCGHGFDAMPRLRRLEQRGAARVLQDPRVAQLPRRTREFLQRALPLLLVGEPVGITPLADEAGYSTSGADRQVKHLLDYGVLEARPKREGGVYRVYKLALNGTYGKGEKAGKS